MSRAKLITKNLYMDNHTFRQAFLTSLTKLNDAATRKLGLEEIRHLLIVHVQDSDRFNSVLSIISENNEYQKIGAKRESAKIIRILSEVFEEHLIRFIPRIMQVVYRKLQEDDNQLHENLSDALGDLVRTSLGHVETDIACTAIRTMMNKLFQLCTKDIKHIQTGSALCVSKIIQATPFPCLELLLDEISSRVAELLRQSNCRSHLQLFECVLSYMMGFKDDRDKLEKSAEIMLPITLYHMANSDWNVRRVAVQVLHVMSILVPYVIKPDLDEILEALNHSRFDKIKNVRDVTSTTLAYIQKLTPPETPVAAAGRKLEISFDRTPSPFSSTKSRDLTKDTKTPTGRVSSGDKKRWPSNILLDLEERRNSIELSMSQRAKSAPKNRPKSVELRKPRQVNPNFFSNAVKNSGEVEIFAKAPTQEPVVETQKTMGSRAYSSNSIKITDGARLTTNSPIKRTIEPNSKQRLSKNQDEVSAHILLSPDFDEAESVMFPSPTAVPAKQFQKYLKERERDRKQVLNREHPSIPVNSIRGSHPSLELGYLNEKNHFNQTQSNNKLKAQPEENVQDNLGVLVKKLDTLNKQQSKTIDSISGFHSTTHTEIDRIKGRLNNLEVFMQRESHSKLPQQSMQYGYPPAYTPPYTPTYLSSLQMPSTFQFPYQTQYANYSSNSNFYPSQGMRADPTLNFQAPPTTNSPKKTYASAQSYQNSCMSTNSLIVPHLNIDIDADEQKGDLSNTSVSNYKKTVVINSKRSSPTRALSRTLSYKRLGERRESKEESSILKSRDYKQDQGDNKALEAKLRELLDEDHINVAYEMCLKRGDENTLLNLMIYSGNVMKQLDLPILESLLMKLRNKIVDKTKVGLVLDWMERIVEDNITVSKETLLGIHEKLIERLETKDTLSGSEYRRMKNLSDNIEIMIDLEDKEDKDKF